MAVISQRRQEAEAPEAAPAMPGIAASVQEARGMRPGGSHRGGLPQQRPAPRPSTAPRGARKGTAMDAMAIFGALAGGS